MSVSSVSSVTSLGASPEIVAAPSEIVTGAESTGQQPAQRAEVGPSYARALPVVVSLAAAAPLAVASPSPVSWLCITAWTVALSTRALSVRAPRGSSGLLRGDARTAVALSFVLAMSAVVGAVPVLDARWGLGVLAAGVAASAVTRGCLPRRHSIRRVVLVGSEESISSYCSSLAGAADVVVAGCYVDDGPALAVPSGADAPTATSLETLPELVARVDADLVLVLPGEDTAADDVRRLTWALEGSPVSVGVLTPVAAVGLHRLGTSELRDRTVLELAPVGASPLQARVKDMLDRLGAAALLLLLSPLLLVLVLAVRLDSKGPGLFVQTRVGRGGATFPMFKLRTMYIDAEAMKQALIANNEADGVLFKIRRDPRVTRLGYWLRRSSLDELPQLLNVLRGEMSLIGPRPALPSEVAAYEDDMHRRHAVKPGITGLWQVSGRSDLLWDDALRLDLYYADNWRLVDDLAIAARTFSAVATGRGAY